MKKYFSLLLAVTICLGMSTSAFAGVEDAYFFGGEDRDEHIYTEQEMESVSSWISKIGFDDYIYLNPTRSKYSQSRLNSGFVYIAGHGNFTRIGTGEGSGICIDGTSGYRDIRNYDFDDAQCVILSACATANPEFAEHALGNVIADNGAQYVLGWRVNVDDGSVAVFNEEFARQLYRGKTFMNAYITAKKNVIDEWRQIKSDSDVFKTYMLGNINATLDEPYSSRSAKRVSSNFSVSVDDFLDERFDEYIVESSIRTDSGNYEDLESYVIENIDSKFNLEDYVIRVDNMTDNVDLIEFKYLYNGMETNYGFTVICIDGYAKLVTLTKSHNDIDIESLGTKRTLSQDQFDDEMLYKDDGMLYEMAIEKDGFQKYTVDEQSVDKYFDVYSSKVVSVVKTVYIDDEGLYFSTSQSF